MEPARLTARRPAAVLLVQFIETWRPLAQWVKANEPGTLGYEAMIADTDPLKVLVFERCVQHPCPAAWPRARLPLIHLPSTRSSCAARTLLRRYISKTYFNDVHRTSQPYLAFKVGPGEGGPAVYRSRQGLWELNNPVVPPLLLYAKRPLLARHLAQEQQAQWRADKEVEVSG